jgi:hypothetical protein
MSGFWHWNLIHLFNFYLAAAFLVSTTLRVRQYRTIVALVRAVPSRWPRLFELVKRHGTLFLSWTTLLPALLALGLLALNMLASHVVWEDAQLTPTDVTRHWQALAAVLLVGGAMVAFDLVGTFWIGEVDRELMQKYFDQAEYWLRSWTAPMVSVFTLGYVNPRKVVDVEVRKALVEASRLINLTLWWVSVQTGLRMAFGLTLWLTYALGSR